MKHNAKKIIKMSVLTMFFVFIVTYAFFRSYNLIFGVNLKNINLKDGAGFDGNILNVSGNAKNAVYLALNDREISIDKDGDFSETIALLKGYNIVEIKARDKFGNVDQKDYQLIQRQPEAEMLNTE